MRNGVSIETQTKHKRFTGEAGGESGQVQEARGTRGLRAWMLAGQRGPADLEDTG